MSSDDDIEVYITDESEWRAMEPSDYMDGDVEWHWLYHRCPQCSSLIETKVASSKLRSHIEGLAVYCWNHEERVETEFVQGSKQRGRGDNLDYFHEIGDHYDSITRGNWQRRNGTAIINCPKCARHVEVSEDLLNENGGHAESETAVACEFPTCNWISPVRIRGYYE